MSQFIGKAPGIDFREQIEEATKSEGVRNAIGIVGVAMKGPTEAVLLSSAQQCITMFGEPHINNCAVQGALACLKNSSEVWFKRVVSANAAKGISWSAPVELDPNSGVPTIHQVVAAPLATPDAAQSYEVKAVVHDGNDHVTVYVDAFNVKKTTNPAGVEAYWCGFGVVAPAGVAAVKYGFTIERGDLALSAPQVLEKAVGPNGEEGISFYTDLGDNSRKKWCRLQWCDAAGADIGAPTDFCINVIGSTIEGGEPIEAARPWAVFTTKDVTSAYNGCCVTLEWLNVGTEDVPKYKVDYAFKNSAGQILENYRCDEDPADELYLGKIISLYSQYLDVDIVGTPSSRHAVTYVMAGGDSGLDATVDDIIGVGNSGMKAFYDPDSIDISTLIVPTWADRKVWEEGIKIGEYRKDIIFIPSLPIGLTPLQVTDLVRGEGMFTTIGLQYDRTFVPVYWPNGLKKNSKTGGYDVVDIVPYIASAYARSEAMSSIWLAPAGVKRGIVQGLDGLEYQTTKEERDMLYSDEVNVNSVVNVKNYGITIMGARTSKVYKITDGNTALKYVNIRRLCNYIRKVVLMESLHNLFDQNDYYTWNDWKMRIDPYFREIKEGRGVYDYQIIMDETTVSQADIDAGRMPGTIRIAPIKPNEYIIINFVVAKDGTVSFSEDVEVI